MYGIDQNRCTDSLGILNGPGPVDKACARALELDVVNVTKIARMLENATENTALPQPRTAAGQARFARDPAEYRPGPARLTLIPGGQEDSR